MGDRPQLDSLLEALGRGDRAAHDAVFALAYDELKRIARSHIRRVGGMVTINPSTLVHEAWIRLAQGGDRALHSSEHLYNVLAQAMRQILLDLARRRGADKRWGSQQRTDLTERIERESMPLDELIAIDSALAALTKADAELAQLVEWHYFAGLEFVEIARVRGQNERTVRRHWDLARAFLLQAMRGATVPAS